MKFSVLGAGEEPWHGMWHGMLSGGPCRVPANPSLGMAPSIPAALSPPLCSTWEGKVWF